jgi:hypothetical protein
MLEHFRVVLLHWSVCITSQCLSAWDSRCIMDQLVPCAPAPALRNKESTVKQALWNITINRKPATGPYIEPFQCSFNLITLRTGDADLRF